MVVRRVAPAHDEYSEARGAKPILMFEQEPLEREEQQSKFLSEVQAWQARHLRAGFKTAEEINDPVTRAIHDYQLANAAGPLDVTGRSDTAPALLPKAHRNYHSGSAMLHL